MTIIAGKHRAHSHHPKRRVITVEELSHQPLEEPPVGAAAREQTSSQVRFGNTERGVDWKPTKRDPLAYLNTTRRHPVVKEKSYVKPEGWDWVP